MIYFDDDDFLERSVDWNATIDAVVEATKIIHQNDFAQPIKPYLRYRDPKNRITSMPAFVGGNVNVAGIKWNASFPGNLKAGLPRAHCIVVLNEADTGRPFAIFNTAALSAIRTASVSGMIIDYFLAARKFTKVTVGIVGMGPIGQHHLRMCDSILGEKISGVIVYDTRNIDEKDIGFFPQNKVSIAKR
jgi:ornithine cyclodeaminase